MIYRETLPSGLRIISEKLEGYRSVSVSCWVRAGAIYESVAPSGLERLGAGTESGISHFIEHMLFKGTEAHGAGEIAERIDALGGNMNAFTSKECTCFYTKVTGDSLEEAVELIAELVCSSKLDEEDIEREKGVVIEEISMNEDTPEDVAHEALCSLYYGSDPLASPVLGTEKSVAAFKRDMLKSYMARRYRPENMVVAAAGELDAKRLRAAVEKSFRFESALTGAATEAQRADEAGGADGAPGERIRLIEKDVEQTHIALAFPGAAIDSEGYYPLLVLNNIVGGSVSSRLFQSIREKRGMAYSVYSAPSFFEKSGYFTLYAGTGEKQAASVLEEMLKEYGELKKSGVGDAELERSKRQIKTGFILGRESTSAHASALGRAELFAREHLSDDEVIKRIDSVTKNAVNDVLFEAADAGRMSAVLVGRVGGCEGELRALLGKDF